MFAWQLFIESSIDVLLPGTRPTPTELARGAQLAQGQIDQEATLAKGLRRIGLTSEADALDVGMKALTNSIEKLTPIAAGAPVTAVARSVLIGTERAAMAQAWLLTTNLADSLSKDVTAAHTTDALGHLRSGRELLLVGVALDLMLVLGAALIFGVRAGRREGRRRLEAQRHAYEIRLQKALDMTTTETAVYDILGASLEDSTPRLKVELLIADTSRAHFERALTNAGDFQGCRVASPADCPAATGGQPLLFPSSGALDACPYLKDRASGACSAACIPVSIAGRTVGVLHAVGPDDAMPDVPEIASLQFTSRRGTDRIAMLRAFASSESETRTDSITGLLNRRSLENQLHELHTAGVPYALAFGGLDFFGQLNDTHGREAGDQVLRLFARVLRDSLRPNDIAARSGEDEFIVALPDCGTDIAVAVLERVRERLVLALAEGRVPSFTVTFGIASTAYAGNFDEILAIADRALVAARVAGRNRVVVAREPGSDREPVDQT